MRAPRWPLWPFEIPGKPHAGLCAAKATARAKEPPGLSDHNERRTFTMATETVTTSGIGARLVTVDTINQMTAKTAQLVALLTNTYGGGGESFRCMNDRQQDNYLWACAEIAEEIDLLASGL